MWSWILIKINKFRFTLKNDKNFLIIPRQATRKVKIFIIIHIIICQTGLQQIDQDSRTHHETKTRLLEEIFTTSKWGTQSRDPGIGIFQSRNPGFGKAFRDCNPSLRWSVTKLLNQMQNYLKYEQNQRHLFPGNVIYDFWAQKFEKVP